MKKSIFIFGSIIAIAILFYPQQSISLSTGSPGGKTGSPTDGVDCMQCHGVLSTSTTTSNITSNIPPSGYVPGNIYNITAVHNGAGFGDPTGFEITCEENTSNTKTGIFFITNSNTTQLVNNGNAVTHTAAGNSFMTWSFNWEAPLSGTGNVTFYGAFIEAGYPIGLNQGDYFSSTTLSASEFIPLLGCTDFLACNYNASASVDDSSCTYAVTLVEVDSLYYGDFDVSCNGASDASAIATGSGVSFVWTDALNNIVSNEQHTPTILSAGIYTVTSTDANNCEGSGIIEITEPTLLSIFVTESNPSSSYQVSCFAAADGWAEVTIDGGVENNNVFGYDISWLSMSSTGSINTIIGDTISDNLSAGFSYTVSVNDANGCNDVATTVVYTEPIEFIAQVTTINYAGPFHGPKKISFIDSTISLESYGFEWIWQNGLAEYFNGVNQIDNEVFDHEFDEDEFNDDEIRLLRIDFISKVAN